MSGVGPERDKSLRSSATPPTTSYGVQLAAGTTTRILVQELSPSTDVVAYEQAGGRSHPRAIGLFHRPSGARLPPRRGRQRAAVDTGATGEFPYIPMELDPTPPKTRSHGTSRSSRPTSRTRPTRPQDGAHPVPGVSGPAMCRQDDRDRQRRDSALRSLATRNGEPVT